jgi:ribulose-phosphate 3-epimerase
MIAADWSNAARDIAEVKRLGCEWLHFDAMDGHFVSNLTLGPMFLEALRAHSDLHFDAHLMLANPGDYIEAFLKAGANSISVHVEGNAHLHGLIGRIKDGGAQAGAVLNPATPRQALNEILPDLDYVLVMSVNPGFGGQKFIESSLDKIRYFEQVRRERDLSFLIQVDGGVGPNTAADVVRAGADVLVCGSALFAPDKPIAENVRDLREAIAVGLKS